jgi:hypothetical protein
MPHLCHDDNAKKLGPTKNKKKQKNEVPENPLNVDRDVPTNQTADVLCLHLASTFSRGKVETAVGQINNEFSRRRVEWLSV